MAGATCSMTVIVSNEAGSALFLHDKGNPHGIWVDAFPLVNYISNGSVAQPSDGAWRTESDGLGTGTQAWAQFKFDDKETVLSLGWDSPFVGVPGARYELKGPKADHYIVEVICSAEKNATCRYIIKNKEK